MKDQTLLFLDASSLQVQVGILRGFEWLAFCECEREALDSLFSGIKGCLNSAKLRLEDLRGFVFCEGPGSVLGIRLAAMAINGWRSLPSHCKAPVFAYYSLEAAAHLLLQRGVQPPFSLISDYRRDLWNLITVFCDGGVSALSRVRAEEVRMLDQSLFYLNQRKQNNPPPSSIRNCNYTFAAAPRIFEESGLLRRVDGALPYSPEKPSYAKWNAQRHQRA